MADARTVYGIYDASDPGRLIRYVGLSKHEPERRLKQHWRAFLKCERCNSSMHAWFQYLLAAGSRPAAVTLEMSDVDNGVAAEGRWIRQLRFAYDLCGDEIGVLNARMDGGYRGACTRSEVWRTLLRMRRALSAGKTAPLTSKH